MAVMVCDRSHEVDTLIIVKIMACREGKRFAGLKGRSITPELRIEWLVDHF